MKNSVRMFFGAMALVMMSVIFAGCNSNTTADGDDSANIRMFYNRGTGISVSKSDAIYQEIEKNTGISLEIISPPMVEYSQKLNIMMASGDIPDIIRFGTLNDMRNYAKQEALSPLDALMKNTENIEAEVGYDVLKYTRVDGSIYAIPMTKTEGKNNVFVRKDWLDKLGLGIPETLDDYTEVLRAFASKDPNSSGSNDTYGFAAFEYGNNTLFSPFFGAFGVMPGCYYMDEKTNEIKPYIIHENTRLALEYLNKLHSERLVNPDWLAIKRQQTELLVESGKAGMSYGWWNYGVNREKTLNQLEPQAELIPIAPPTGPGGLKGNRSGGAIGNNCYSITASSKHKEKSMEFLDYFFGIEGSILSAKGIEGVHWTWKDGKKTPSTFEELNEMVNDFEVLDNYNGDLNLFEPQHLFFITAGVEENARASIIFAENQPVIKDYGHGLSCDELVKYGTSLNFFTDETFVKIIIGDLPVSYFDEYVQQWKKEGGNEIIRAMTEQYNELSK